MFNFNELNDIHLEISNNCQASCPMCNRNIRGGPDNPLLSTSDWTLEEFKQILNEEVLRQLRGFYFCGNFGDPMMNDDVLDMIDYSVNINNNLHIRFHTNGGARKIEWWQKLAKVLPKNHRVIFAIDGLEDTHNLYRIGTNYEIVLRNAKAFINAGGIAEWCFIRFKHNEHQLEEAQRRAKEFKFAQFTFKNSSRFLLEPKIQVLNKKGENIHIIEPASDTPIKFIDKKVIDNINDYMVNSTIDCQVLHTKEIYIDAYKTVMPCCWIAHIPYTYIENDAVASIRQTMVNQYYSMMDKLGGVKNMNAIHRSIKDILSSEKYHTIWDNYWNHDKFITCTRTCGRGKADEFSKSIDQQSAIVKLN
jgi:hypothetical protein